MRFGKTQPSQMWRCLHIIAPFKVIMASRKFYEVCQFVIIVSVHITATNPFSVTLSEISMAKND